MKFVATKTADQRDLQALHLVSHRTGIINQIRAFLLERNGVPAFMNTMAPSAATSV